MALLIFGMKTERDDNHPAGQQCLQKNKVPRSLGRGSAVPQGMGILLSHQPLSATIHSTHPKPAGYGAKH